MTSKERLYETMELAREMCEKDYTISELSLMYGMKRSTVHWRLSKYLKNNMNGDPLLESLYEECKDRMKLHKRFIRARK